MVLLPTGTALDVVWLEETPLSVSSGLCLFEPSGSEAGGDLWQQVSLQLDALMSKACAHLHAFGFTAFSARNGLILPMAPAV